MKHCGNMDDHTDSVRMLIDGRVRSIDPCIAPIVAALNADGADPTIATTASCCGHDDTKLYGSIRLKDGRWLIVVPDHATSQRLWRVEATTGRPEGG